MPKIEKLSPHVADLIAAGEVVERPGSVIKELIENAIDAGATMLTVEIRSGGMLYMRVTDNGCGIAPEDAETAFLRHATSKLHDARGLEAISTLGFRGEALAAIAAVSKVELTTREKGADEGTYIALSGGVVTERKPIGCPEGTTMVVRELFFNTPARLKFMKNDRAEGANISSVVIRCALSHPEVSIRYIKEGKEEFHTPGDGRMDSCVYSLLGRDFALGLLKAESDDGDVSVKGYVSTPGNARGNRSYQFFFVNGRFIKSKLLQAAVEQAYKNSLFTGRFPACVLHIRISPAMVDVNVHPTKSEVKFVRERQVFDGVYYAVLAAVEGEKKTAEISISNSTEKAVHMASPKPEMIEKPAASKEAPKFSGKGFGGAPKSYGGAKVMSAFGGTILPKTFEKKASVAPEMPAKKAGTAPFADLKPVTPKIGGYTSGGVTPVAKEEQAAPKPVQDEHRTVYETRQSLIETVRQESFLTAEPETAPAEQAAAEKPFRLIGEALSTYILVEQEDKLYLIDKHAAHERILFDALKAEKQTVTAQLLLVPVVCQLSSENQALLEQNREILEKVGFDVEAFGENKTIVRQVPADMETGDIQPMLEEICEKLAISGKTGMEDRRDNILHTVACKAAIKAGKMSEPAELERLAGRVLSGEVRYCPHGRPVAAQMTRQMIDKFFKRI